MREGGTKGGARRFSDTQTVKEVLKVDRMGVAARIGCHQAVSSSN